MDKTSTVASSTPEGLPSMQFDGRALLSDPEQRGWEEDAAAGNRRMEAAVQAGLQVRNGAAAGLFSLLLVAAAGIFLPDALATPGASWWLALMTLAGLIGASGWLVVRRVGIRPFRVVRWRLAGALWCGAIALLWGVAFGRLLHMPWHEGTAMTLAASAMGAAFSLVAAAPWLPALLLSWGALLAAQLLAGPADHAGLLVPVLSFDLVILAMGMMLGMSSRETAQRTVAERASRRELAELKARVADQVTRLSSEAEERRDIEKALYEARGAADVASRAKSEFLATMSHEIRTPLNGILPILEILRESDLDDEQRRFLDTAYHSSRHLLRVINDVLDFSRAESGRLELESIEVDLRELVESITDLMGRSAEGRGLKLHYRIGDDVPRRVRGDPLRLRQILTNLISNAIKFTEQGEIRIEVQKRRASRKEVELLFSVSDTGVGMSGDTRRRLFRPFAQADASTTRRHGGTGLGLVICKRLVELMGGRIGVKSKPGEGSRFWFALPMRKSASEVPPARMDLAGLRVMTLVDDAAMAAELSEVLSDWQMVEEQADSAVSALSRLRSSAQLGRSWGFDLLLLAQAGGQQGLVRLLRDIRREPGLEELKVGVFTPSSGLSGELQKELGVFVMETPVNYRALQRRLHRLFDVEGQRLKSEEDTQALFDSLALDFDPGAAGELPAHPVVRGAAVGRALVVEDNPVNLSVARRMLAKLGIDTLVARNGQEALATLEREPVDLVLMDCQMPAMDGYEATRRLRALEEESDPPRHLPVVAMTANAMRDDRDKCLQAGMDDYLAKPLDFASLRRVLEPWVRLGDGRRHAQQLTMGGQALQNEAVFEPGDLEGLRDRPAVGDDGGAALDAARLAELRALMAEELPRLLGDYLDTTPKLLASLDEAAASGKLEHMAWPAHTLKSSSANVCAMRLSDLAERLEAAARGGETERARTLHARLLEEYQRVEAALRGLLN